MKLPPPAKSLNKLTQPEADRFVEVLKSWTVDADDQNQTDVSLRKKGWLSLGATLVVIENKAQTLFRVLEPCTGTFSLVEGECRPVFIGPNGISGKWVVKQEKPNGRKEEDSTKKKTRAV